MKRFAIALILVLISCLCCAQPGRFQPPKNYELACPAGYSPQLNGGSTFDAITGLWRANICVANNGSGTVVCQMNGCAGIGPVAPTTEVQFPIAAQTPPTGATNTCPTSGGTVNPFAWIQKSDLNYYSLAGVDTTTQAPLVAPFGVFTFCQPVFFNDTGIVPIFMKNNMISFYHQFEAAYEGVGNTLDDRAIGIRAETLSSITGSAHARMQGIYGETGIKGTPTGFGSGPDSGVNGIRWTIDDSRTGGTLSGSGMIAIDGSYQDSTSGTAATGACGFECSVGVRGVAQSDSGKGTGIYTGGAFYADNGVVGNTNLGIGILAQGPKSLPFGSNIILFTPSCIACNATDILWRNDDLTHSNQIAGPLILDSGLVSGVGPMTITGSVQAAGSLQSAKFATPPAPAVGIQGVAGSTTYTYAYCAHDGNGGVVCSGVSSVTNGNAVLSGSNSVTIQIDVSVNGRGPYDVYRTFSGGTPATTGKINASPLTPPALIGSGTHNNFFFNDTGLAGDGTTLPVGNNTGSVQGYKFKTLTACASSASPAVCADAAAGFVVIAAGSTAVTVNTTAMRTPAQVFVQEDSSLGAALGVTCNTTIARNYVITARVDNTSFTITSSAAPTTNPACLSYQIVN